MKIINNIAVWGDPVDQGALDQITRCASVSDIALLMADHHKGYSVPIGGVVANRDRINISAVGYDIACGNKAVLTDLYYSDIKTDLPRIMDEIYDQISFGVGRSNNELVDDDLFDLDHWDVNKYIVSLKQLARNQLGTVGSGNHYVDLLRDEQARIWIGVHFGSRGLGHKIASYFLKEGGAVDSIDAMPLVIDYRNDLAQDYLVAMELAGKYAYAGRNWVCNKVLRILDATELDSIHNHHNYLWRELYKGDYYWVGRKGATPAFPGQRGFIGGSMGDTAVIVEGKQSDESILALYSTIHGAGRVMSRTQARGKIHRKTGVRISDGEVSPEMMYNWIDRCGIELRGGGLDESPHCYKRLPDVLEHHKNTIDILHTLMPIGVAMAGNDIVDPYKD